MEMVKEPKKPKLLLLVLIQIQKLVIEGQEPGAVLVIHQPKNLEIVGFSSFRKGVEGVMKGPELSDEVTTDQGANAFSQYIRE